jgi:hypothetical protein
LSNRLRKRLVNFEKINEISYANKYTSAQNSITNLLKTLGMFKAKLYFIGIISVFIWGLLAWNYFHGGVPSHHILNKKNLPEISNWWGGIWLPVFAWIVMFRIQKRENLTIKNVSDFPLKIIYGFVGSLIIGISIATLFLLEFNEFLGYFLPSILIIALFYPIYYSECFLGFVLGMTYTFGAILPTGIGSILAILAFLIYQLIRPAGLYAMRLLKILPNK